MGEAIGARPHHWLLLRSPNEYGNRNLPIAMREQMENSDLGESLMLDLNPPMLLAIAALISSLSALIWSLRRRA